MVKTRETEKLKLVETQMAVDSKRLVIDTFHSMHELRARMSYHASALIDSSTLHRSNISGLGLNLRIGTAA